MNEYSDPILITSVLDTQNIAIQHQLTRTCLLGRGIVCGLNIHADDQCHIHLHAGTALSSNGQLIHLDSDISFKYYRSFVPSRSYPPLEDRDSGQAYDLWELLPNAGPERRALAPQSREDIQNPFIEEKVALLFLEPGIPDENSTEANPDNSEDSYKLKVLLIKREDVISYFQLEAKLKRLTAKELTLDPDFVWEEDFSREDNRPSEQQINQALNPRLLLKTIGLKRFALGDQKEGKLGFKALFNDLDSLYKLYVEVIADSINLLDRELRRASDMMKLMLNYPQHEDPIFYIDQLCRKWEAFLKKNKGADPNNHKKEYAQYYYDWMRDLIQAYDEFRELFAKIYDNCCPDKTQFPRHIFLGEVLESNPSRIKAPFKTDFESASIFNGNQETLRKTQLYFWRILLMISNFYLPDYIDDADLNPYCEPEDEDDLPDFSKIKVTPGRSYEELLGNQTIPFYYLLSLSKYSVHRYWNFELACRESVDMNRSYHAFATDIEEEGIESYTDKETIINPLHYHLGSFPFFRIEGHIGKTLEELKDDLALLSRSYNLPFEVRGTSISNLTAQINLPEKEIIAYQNPRNLGMEHYAGVREGGTFIMVLDETNTKIIADFSLPYRCCTNSFTRIPEQLFNNPVDSKEVKKEPTAKQKANDPPVKTQKKTKSSSSDALIAKLGKATSDKKDDLKKISGIGPGMEKSLNEIGIYTFDQLAKLSAPTYKLLDNLMKGPNKGKAIREKWAVQAKKLKK